MIGLASRQFEAALSGVGGRERRTKGERGKEKESLAPAGNDGPSSDAPPPSSSVLPSHGAGAVGSDEVEPLPSPKKERTRRGRGGGGGGASSGPSPVKVSGILQRVDTAPAVAIEHGAGESSINVSVNSAAVASTSATPGVVGGGSRGGGRRGRGRGGHTKEKVVVPPTIKSGG